MKRIMLSVVVTPSDDDVTLENLKETLSHLGSTYFPFGAEVELANIENPTEEVWVYVSPDDEEPYRRVSAPGVTEGDELSDEETERLRKNGAVLEFFAEYPRADKYGSPMYATHDEFAAAWVGEHLFKVAAEDFKVRHEDRGDDGAEQVWLKIGLPAV